MNIFNSLGSNYDFNYLVNGFFSLFKNDRKRLENLLQEKYEGKPILFYKGREAIEAALIISDLKKGDCVAVNGFTCYVVEKAVENNGLTCEYLDISDDLNFTSTTLEKALNKNKKIKAVIIQNTLGNMSDYLNIKKLCVKNNLILIDDLAHTTKAGDSDFTAISFSQDKAIDSVSGGALIIKNPKYFKNIYKINQKNIKNSSEIKDFLYPFLTFGIRNLYQFGIGKVLHFIFRKLNILSTPMGDQGTGLHFLPRWHVNMAYYYLNKINNVTEHRKIITKIYGGMNVNIRYPILVKNRPEFIKFMKSNGVYLSDIWYESVVAPKKYMINSKYKKGICPNADNISSNIVNLPTHINVTIKNAQKINNLIYRWNTTQ